jgi:hypothetical protein
MCQVAITLAVWIRNGKFFWAHIRSPPNGLRNLGFKAISFSAMLVRYADVSSVSVNGLDLSFSFVTPLQL